MDGVIPESGLNRDGPDYRLSTGCGGLLACGIQLSPIAKYRSVLLIYNEIGLILVISLLKKLNQTCCQKKKMNVGSRFGVVCENGHTCVFHILICSVKSCLTSNTNRYIGCV